MMGIPCGHMIKDMKFQVLPLNAIYNQWRINAQLLNNDQHAGLDDEDDQINSLLLDFKEKYEKLPILQKDDTKRQLSKFVGTSFPQILEPKIQPHKGRPLGSNIVFTKVLATIKVLVHFKLPLNSTFWKWIEIGCGTSLSRPSLLPSSHSQSISHCAASIPTSRLCYMLGMF
ncbi:unnamed protein product [Prunus armeniaca]